MRCAGRVLLAPLVLAGCASVLGLEQRTLDDSSTTGEDAGPSDGRKDSGGRDGDPSTSSSSSSSSGDVDGGADGGAIGLCPAGGLIVFEATQGTGADTIYRYSTSQKAIDGFSEGQAMFRLLNPGVPGADQPLYLLREPSTGDLSVSPHLNEGTYATPELLGYSFRAAGDGLIPIYRWVHQDSAPLRHRLNTSQDYIDGYSSDDVTYWVCPLP